MDSITFPSTGVRPPSFRLIATTLIVFLAIQDGAVSAPAVVRSSMILPYGDWAAPSLSEVSDRIVERWDSIEEELKSAEPFSEEPETVSWIENVIIPKDDNATETECDQCIRFVGLLHSLLQTFEFSDLQTPVTRICYRIIDSIPDPVRLEELCNGSIAIQGPHVAIVINSTTPERFCQFQNLCYQENRGSHQRRSKSRSRTLDQVRKTADQNRRPANRRPKVDESSIKIVQLTDIHIDVRYSLGSLADCGLPTCCLEEYGEGDAQLYGDYNCDIPPRTIEVFLKKIAQDIKPDFLVYTGDISGSRVWDETQQEILNISSTLIGLIAKTIPNGTYVFPAFGNHEMFPTNLFYKGNPDLEDLTSQVTDWWAPVAGFQDEQVATMKHAGYYSVHLKPDLRLISYNTNYMYTRDWYNVINTDNRTEVHEMIAFIEKELEDARTSNQKVILLGHHPPSSADYLYEYGHWYHELILEYADVIVLQPTGHKHSDYFNLVPDLSTGVPESVVYVAPAVTAGGTMNPAMRVYYLNPTTYTVEDYDQYYFDLGSHTGDGEPEIKKLYTASEEYSLPDLSPASWSALVDRMETDDALLLLHMTHRSADAQVVTSCDADCELRHVCSLRTITYDKYLDCVDSYQLPTSAAKNVGHL